MLDRSSFFLFRLPTPQVDDGCVPAQHLMVQKPERHGQHFPPEIKEKKKKKKIKLERGKSVKFYSIRRERKVRNSRDVISLTVEQRRRGGDIVVRKKEKERKKNNIKPRACLWKKTTTVCR